MATADAIAALAASGWNTCTSIRETLERAGLPIPTASYLRKNVGARRRERAEQAVMSLRDHFRAARFADEATFGILLVPDLAKLDTRAALDGDVRRDQFHPAKPDFVDSRLPAGAVVTERGVDWSLVATVTGWGGLGFGSYLDVIDDAMTDAFTVDDVDTRSLMTRQLWGARVLQSGTQVPDSELNEKWTFTLFAGEDLVEGQVASGTVLHRQVRQRLGKVSRGIASARVCPALVIE